MLAIFFFRTNTYLDLNISEDPVRSKLNTDKELDTKNEKNIKSSADWLGLRDSPKKVIPLNTTLKSEDKRTIDLGFGATGSTLLEATEKMFGGAITGGSSMQSQDISSTLLAGSLKPRPQTAKNRSKGRLLDELFGESKLPADETFKIGNGKAVNHF